MVIFYFYILSIIWGPEILHFGVLVGAFSDFGRADTGKPVQIYGLFCIFEAWAEF